jgi:hypothetical protein
MKGFLLVFLRRIHNFKQTLWLTFVLWHLPIALASMSPMSHGSIYQQVPENQDLRRARALLIEGSTFLGFKRIPFVFLSNLHSAKTQPPPEHTPHRVTLTNVLEIFLMYIFHLTWMVFCPEPLTSMVRVGDIRN